MQGINNAQLIRLKLMLLSTRLSEICHITSQHLLSVFPDEGVFGIRSQISLSLTKKGQHHITPNLSDG